MIEPQTRLFRITCNPVASFLAVFVSTDSGACKVRGISGKIILTTPAGPSDVESMYAVGVSVNISPAGGFKGTAVFQVTVEKIQPQDEVRFRFTSENHPNATLKLEIFDWEWKLIVNSSITTDTKAVPLKW